jgi:hypothetical protein
VTLERRGAKRIRAIAASLVAGGVLAAALGAALLLASPGSGTGALSLLEFLLVAALCSALAALLGALGWRVFRRPRPGAGEPPPGA